MTTTPPASPPTRRRHTRYPPFKTAIGKSRNYHYITIEVNSDITEWSKDRVVAVSVAKEAGGKGTTTCRYIALDPEAGGGK